MIKIMPALNLNINSDISPQGCKLLVDRRLPIQQKKQCLCVLGVSAVYTNIQFS